MHCNGCGTNKACRTCTGYKNGRKWEICDMCGNQPPVWIPDIYLGGKGGIQIDECLCDKKGKEIPFQTKREKAVIMKQLGLGQAPSAEKEHGARNEMYLHRKTHFV